MWLCTCNKGRTCFFNCPDLIFSGPHTAVAYKMGSQRHPSRGKDKKYFKFTLIRS
ncbi:hypothetical protein ENTCAN_05187 [Enterobacter cancerogenus ATCC 35316]|nr:hypothetical protein ENTCAN_05187 [Enterobacter cancerogenus ATCC 35316]